MVVSARVEFRESRSMRFWDYQDMARVDGLNVQECHNSLIGINYAGQGSAFDNATENAISNTNPRRVRFLLVYMPISLKA